MNSQSTTSESARPADPGAIERELSALWKAEAEAQKKAGGAATLTRTVLLNLLIFARDQASADRAREDVIALTSRQPSRSILMLAEEGASASALEAWVSLYCATQPGEGRRVCGEQINLEARGPAILDLPPAVLPLLLANVPTFLWWQSGNPFVHPIYDNLARAVDRVIVDSLTFAEPRHDFGDAARAARSGPAAVTDLGWARLTPWRSLTARIFDPQGMRHYLNELERVRIATYAGSPALAWLYAAWLATRLEWRLAEQDPAGMRFEGGQVIEFDTLAPGDERPGYFASAQLRARDGATFAVARLPNSCAVTRLNVGGQQTEQVVSVRYDTSAEWLGRELNRLARSETFEAAASLLARPV